MIKEAKVNEGYLKNTVIYALGDVIPKALAFISFPILTRYLTTEDYGIVNYVNSLTMFLLVFNVLGLNTYYLVHYHKCDTDEERKKLFGTLSIFIFFYNVILLFIFSFAGGLFDKHFNSKIPFWPFIFIAVFSGFFNAFSLLPLASLRLKHKSFQFAIINIGKNIVQLLMTIILVVVVKMSALGVIYSILIANAVFFIYFSIYIYQNAVFQFDKAQLIKALRFSLPLVPGSLAYLLINLLDRIIIARFLSLSDLGLYGTAATLGFLINIISTGFYQALEPHIFKCYNQENFKKEFERIRRIFLVILLSVALGLAFLAKEFLYFMSNEGFHSAYLYVPIILIGGVFSGMNLLYATVITASGRTKVNSVNTIIGCLISIGTNFILVPWIGITGAAVAFTVAFAVIFCLSMTYSHFSIFSIKEIIICMIWLSAIYFLVYYLNFSPSLYSILIKTITVCIFALFALRFLGVKLKQNVF